MAIRTQIVEFVRGCGTKEVNNRGDGSYQKFTNRTEREWSETRSRNGLSEQGLMGYIAWW